MKKRYNLILLFLLTLMGANSLCAQVAAVTDYAFITATTSSQIAIANVLANDFINGQPATLSNVIIRQITTEPGIQLLANGAVEVAGTTVPYLDFAIEYEICEIANPNNCSTAYFLVSAGEGVHANFAPDVTIISDANCTDNSSTIQFDNFPISDWTTSYFISIGGVGYYRTATTLMGEPVIFNNVPPGVLTFVLEDTDGIGRISYGGLYIPEPICEINLTFDGLVQDLNLNNIQDVGDSINYQFTVTNGGSTPLTTITIDSPTLNIIGTPIDLLAPGNSNSSNFTAVYMLTQEDINSGLIEHFATVSGTNGVTIKTDNYGDTTVLRTPDGIRIITFYDTNNNSIKDINESQFYSLNGSYTYEINNNGIIHNIISYQGFVLYENNPTNTYQLTYTVDPDYSSIYTSTIPSISATVPAGSGITTYYFPIVRTPYVDLSVYLYGTSAPPRPGRSYKLKLQYSRSGSIVVNSGTLTFTKDPRTTITNVSVPVTLTATGFTLNNINFNFLFGSQIIEITMQVDQVPAVNIGDLLDFSCSISSIETDFYYVNNNSSFSRIVVNSYDPNDKNEHHGGKIEHASFTDEDYMTYTIRFENIGTSDALDVRIEDLLDSKLEPSTVKMIASSHRYVLDRVDNSLTWKFDGINLPPSVLDTEIGKGYIVFQVKPKPGFAIGDIIPNTADIYFDFNPAIVTNTCTTEFVPLLGVNAFASDSFEYYPNPTSDIVTFNLKNTSTTIETIEVMDILGKILISKTVQYSTAEIDLSSLNQGLYLIKLKANGQTKTVKITKN